jgi:hypothetical protein
MILNFADDNKNILESKKVITSFLEAFSYNNVEKMIGLISRNYLDIDKNGKIVDYEKFITILKNFTNDFFKKYVAYSFDNINIVEKDIAENKVNIVIEFEWKVFNIVTLEWESGKAKRAVSLAKEGGEWKITCLKSMQ